MPMAAAPTAIDNTTRSERVLLLQVSLMIFIQRVGIGMAPDLSGSHVQRKSFDCARPTRACSPHDDAQGKGVRRGRSFDRACPCRAPSVLDASRGWEAWRG